MYAVTVRVRLFAAMREAAGTAELTVAPGSVQQVLAGLSERFGEPFTTRLQACSVLVNGTAVDKGSASGVPDGAEIALLPPVSGGSAEASPSRPGAQPQEAVTSDEMWVERRPEVSVARALGSATRAGIYEHLQQRDEGVAVREVAEQFGLHPNVSRTHLETLADAGLVMVGQRRRAAGGRPAKLYKARGDAGAIRAEVAAGGDGAGLLVEILAALAENSSTAAASELPVAAAEVAHMEGRRLAALARAAAEPHDDLEVAVTLALTTLAEHVPGVRLLRVDGEVAHLTAPQGAFVALRERRPVLGAAVERGLLAGATAVLAGPVDIAPAQPLPDGTAVWRLRRAPQAKERVVPIAQVDTRGEPRDAGVLRSMRAIGSLEVGAILEVFAEGPGSPAAFARWIDRAGHELLAVERVDNVGGRRAIRLLIRRGA